MFCEETWYNDTKDDGGCCMIRLIACDLDETLLSKDKTISKENLEAIHKVTKEYGVLFVPASGRGYTSMDSVLRELGIHGQKGTYTISNNGGVVVENETFDHITFHSFEFSLAQQLFAYGIEQGLCVEVFTASDVYGFLLNESEREWLFMFKKDAVECEETSIEFLRDQQIVKVLFECEDMELLKKTAQDMSELTRGKANVSFSSNRYMELNPIGVNKGVGLRELANHLGIAIEETMAIGDNYNDVELLEEAGVAVAVANANEDVKKLADFVTSRDHDHGAVAEAIEQYIDQMR